MKVQTVTRALSGEEVLDALTACADDAALDMERVDALVNAIGAVAVPVDRSLAESRIRDYVAAALPARAGLPVDASLQAARAAAAATPAAVPAGAPAAAVNALSAATRAAALAVRLDAIDVLAMPMSVRGHLIAYKGFVADVQGARVTGSRADMTQMLDTIEALCDEVAAEAERAHA